MPSKASKPAATKPTRPGPGRPSSYTPELATAICERIAEGLSLRKICVADDMPDRTTVNRWLAADPEFAAKYARAREEQGDLMDDRQLDVVQKLESGEMDPHTAKVIVGVLQWRASKLVPKRYGDRLALDHAGEVTLNDAQLDARIDSLGASLLTALGQAAVTRLDGAAGREEEEG